MLKEKVKPVKKLEDEFRVGFQHESSDVRSEERVDNLSYGWVLRSVSHVTCMFVSST